MTENDKLHDALERQSELITALHREIALLKAKNAEQIKTIVALTAQYREQASEGKTYSEGCRP